MSRTTINPTLRYTRVRQVISLCQYPFHNSLTLEITKSIASPPRPCSIKANSWSRYLFEYAFWMCR
jgi:hypothetical protein